WIGEIHPDPPRTVFAVPPTPRHRLPRLQRVPDPGLQMVDSTNRGGTRPRIGAAAAPVGQGTCVDLAVRAVGADAARGMGQGDRAVRSVSVSGVRAERRRHDGYGAHYGMVRGTLDESPGLP